MPKSPFDSKTFFILIYSFFSLLTQGQTDFRSGYVIKSIGDTLFGQLDYRTDERMSNICTYRKDEKSNPQEFLPGSIVGYRFTDSRYFISDSIPGKLVFLEFLVEGQLNLYYLREDMNNHYYLKKNSFPLKELPYESGIKVVDGRSYFYEKKNYIGYLKYYLQDAPVLDSKINKMHSPNHDNLIEIAEAYHNAVCDGAKCVIYEKKSFPIKLDIDFLGGLFFPLQYDESSILKPKQYGVIGHLWQPSTDERFFLRSGILFSNYEYETSNGNLTKVPLQIEYLYPTGVIKPSIALGINLYYIPSWFLATPSIVTGLNFKLDKNIYWKVCWDIDFLSNAMFIPVKLYSNSLLTGISIRL